VTRAFRENNEPALRSFHSSLEEFVHSQMSRIDPRLAVVFTVCEEGDENNAADDAIIDMSLVDKILPASCQSLSLGCRGIVTNNAEVENNVPGGFLVELATGMLVFPAFKHVRVTPFRIESETDLLSPESDEAGSDSDDWDVDNSYGDESSTRRRRQRGAAKRAQRKIGTTLSHSDYRAIFENVTEKKIPLDQEEVKCCVMLENYLDEDDDGEITSKNNDFLDSVLAVTNGKAAIGGCIGSLARSSQGQDTTGLYHRYSKAIGLVFSVPKGKADRMQAFSLLLPRNVRGEKAVKAAMNKAKEAGFPMSGPGTSSCAMMFSCCARGENFHKRKGLELACFKSVFPETPVVGLFVLGEIGHTYLGGEGSGEHTQQLPNKSFNTSRNMRHQMCSMYILLSFKQP